VPSNFIDVGIAPFSYTYETLPANERMTWIMNHESIHIVMGDNANDRSPFSLPVLRQGGAHRRRSGFDSSTAR
jgi:hypothetical protein